MDDDMLEIPRLLRRLATPIVTTDQAYEFGRSSVIDGPNTENCHFSIFGCQATTAAWEEGAADARAESAPAPTKSMEG